MRLFVVLSFIILTTSCRKELQTSFPDYPSSPAINGIIFPDSLIKINVSMAGRIDSNKLPYVDNAEIELYIDSVLSEKLAYTGSGNYYSTKPAQIKKTYECKISIPGFKPISGRSTIPAPARIFNIIANKEAGKDEEGYTFQSVTFTFNNNPSEKQYFEIDIRDLNGYKALMKKVIDPVLLNEGLPILLFSNEMIKDSIYSMTINFAANGSTFENSPAIMKFKSVSYDYYMYVRHLYLYEKGRYPDFEQGSALASPLYSNIKNGLGIFASFSYTSDTLFKETLFNQL